MNTKLRNMSLLIFALNLLVSGCGPGQLLGTTVTPPPTVLPTSTPVISVSPVDGMVLVFVPAGEFIMGSNDGDFDEKPVRTVYLDAFWIDQTEVTHGMYAKCTAAGCKKPTCAHGGDNHPVACIDWKSASAYCEWAGRRLPTEAEWEKAARGTDGRIYPWGNEPAICEYAVMDDLTGSGNGCGQKSAWEVGSKPKGVSPYGALDMAGNVAEWVADWENLDAANGSGYVLRGGGYLSIPSTVRTTKREVFHWPVDKYEGLGFRCGTSEH
jgi:serine/threonine-protein kinase